MPRKKFHIIYEKNYHYTHTLCWECKWATGLEGKCPWAKDGTPVDGWKAKRTKIQSAGSEKMTKSYKVSACPLFEADESAK